MSEVCPTSKISKFSIQSFAAKNEQSSDFRGMSKLKIDYISPFYGICPGFPGHSEIYLEHEKFPRFS